MKNFAVAAVALLGVALSGCATIIEGSSQRIAVSTTPVSGARCVLSNGEGKWAVITPGHVKVARSKHDMKVRCTKDGYAPVTATIASDLETWTLVNFLILDLPGLGLDAATGAINAYPDSNKVRMKQQGYDATQDPSQDPSQDQYPGY